MKIEVAVPSQEVEDIALQIIAFLEDQMSGHSAHAICLALTYISEGIAEGNGFEIHRKTHS